MMHLTQRVAWHDAQWSGRICTAPSRNPYCVALEEIHKNRDDETEDRLAGRSWSELQANQLPPCVRESGGFMNEQEWTRRFTHPYANVRDLAKTHGQLKPTNVLVPPFTTFAVPFGWMLCSEQDSIQRRTSSQLPPDEEPPFSSPWVFGRARQEALLELFFKRVRPNSSLVFFYTKQGNPLGDEINRLVVALGHVTGVAEPLSYESENVSTYPMWDRRFSHSIRADGTEGFLVPYHDYLEQTGDPDEDARRQQLLRQIAVVPDRSHIRTFSYVSEWATPDIALATLVSSLAAVRRIREHGIAAGPWLARESWLNEQIARAWKDRGAFPGLGAVLEALGLRLGTALVLELSAAGAWDPNDDPWAVVDAILSGRVAAPREGYGADIEAIRDTWLNLAAERRALMRLLSRFDLTLQQARRWLNPGTRERALGFELDDASIIENPYRIAETDAAVLDDPAIDISTLDRGLLPDATVSANHPTEQPSAVVSPNDPRRVRGIIVDVLRRAAEDGDSFLAAADVLERVEALDLEPEITIGSDWLAGSEDTLEGAVDLLEVEAPSGSTEALQLVELADREAYLSKVLPLRAAKKIPSLEVGWEPLIVEAVKAAGHAVDLDNPRHARALEEQAAALEATTSRRLAVLTGSAGTGKTAVVGALMRSDVLQAGGILLLAPTGKARVRLAQTAGGHAMTVAQFLFRLGRYEGDQQRVRFTGDTYRAERTVVIDECSMLTLDQFVALLKALDLSHVERIILVGDPNQLPPIGVGRPFADLVAFLDRAADSAEPAGGALARLTVELRTATGGDASDTLRLASLFTAGQPAVADDRVLSDLDTLNELNDLTVAFWSTPDDLEERLGEQLVEQLGLETATDVAGFNNALGFDADGWVPYEDPGGAENFQILTPVRMKPHGVHELNRWMHRCFRAAEITMAREPWATSLGDENIVLRDKVIQLHNQTRRGFDGTSTVEEYLANGEVGLVARDKNGWLDVAFAQRPRQRFGYSQRDFKAGDGPLQLAYVLTVHKAQGSEFETVFVVLPKQTHLLSRELLYTALTRARTKLVLLLEGDDASALYDYSRPEQSATLRRNTNLFQTIVRFSTNSVPYAEGLIHRTSKGHMVRSKSELVIANVLHEFELSDQYEYERPVSGPYRAGTLRPDFSFVDPAGDLIIWEHLGLLTEPKYRESWEWKRQWYLDNGWIENETIFTTRDDEQGGLDSRDVRQLADRIKALI